ncbi:MAG: phytoene desaturase family protein, partial [Acidimicrobiales bacterium]
MGPGGLGELARLLLSSTRELGDRFMASPEAKSLVACWAMHLDFGPDVSGGAMFPFLELFAGMEAGMSVVEGGASRLSDALAAVVVAHGGEIRTGTPVERVVVDRGAACGVETAGGERIAARRAVVANVTPTLLAEHLLPPGALPGRARIQAASYAYGPATMVVHLALRGPLPWEAGGDLDQFGYVHVAPYVDDLASTYTEAVGGLLPRSPLLVVGQTTAVDPSRAPAGHHVVWIQVRALPARIQGDSLGRISARSWPD